MKRFARTAPPSVLLKTGVIVTAFGVVAAMMLATTGGSAQAQDDLSEPPLGLPSNQNNNNIPPPPPPISPPLNPGGDVDDFSDYVPPPIPGVDFEPGDDFGQGRAGPSGPATTAKTPADKPKSGATSPGKKVPPGQDLVSIDFPEPTAIKDIIKAVGQWGEKNFILDQGVSSNKKIQIISPQQVTKEEAYQSFLSALNVAGLTTVDTGKVVKIVPTMQAKSANIKTFYGSSWSPMTDEIITQIIPLENIDAKTVATQLQSILRNSSAVPFSTKMLIVSDTGHKIRRLLEIIRLLDVKGNQPQVSILPLKYTDAKDTKTKVEEVFGGRGGGSALYLDKVLIDERQNALILVGPPRGLDDVVRLVARLDKPLDDQNTQAQIHVRNLDYADAESTLR